MPAIPRPISDRRYYHLMAKGISSLPIFENRTDYVHFLNNLKQYSTDHHITVNAYCLMNNHIHLLICDPKQNKSAFMKRRLGITRFGSIKNMIAAGTCFRAVTLAHQSRAMICFVPFFAIFSITRGKQESVRRLTTSGAVMTAMGIQIHL